ncbi:MAG: ribonuclease HI [Anaerolineae bacterium]
MTDPLPVVVYTDGACSGNPGPGGWCAILRYGPHEKVLQGGASLTTNNRMELRAALAALQALKRPCVVEIHTDSEYLKNGITEWLPLWLRNGWRTRDRQPVKNQDLWRALYAETRKHRITWHWVAGHAGDELNERADRLAVAALNKIGVRGEPDLEEPEAAVPPGSIS